MLTGPGRATAGLTQQKIARILAKARKKHSIDKSRVGEQQKERRKEWKDELNAITSKMAFLNGQSQHLLWWLHFSAQKKNKNQEREKRNKRISFQWLWKHNLAPIHNRSMIVSFMKIFPSLFFSSKIIFLKMSWQLRPCGPIQRGRRGGGVFV